VRLLIDGTPIREDACSPATGSFFPDKQQWHAEATLPLKAGKHTLRVEQAIPNGLPHLDKFALVPVEPATPTAGRRPTGDADALARKTGLHTPIVRAWQAYLGQSRADDPVFGPWLALAALPDDGFADKAAELVRGWRSAKPGWRPAVVAAFATAEPPATLAQVASRYARLLEESDDAVVKAIRENPAGPLAVPADPTVLLLPAERERLSAAEAATKTAREAKIPGTPMALAVQDEDKSTDLKVHLRGNYLTLGEPAPRLFPRILAGEDQKPLTGPGSGRLELARWIASPTNPLTARVIVNRVWQHHLGEGIVRSPDNFGALGERPTHPELLDWLTEHFVADGWSLKKLHRRIMLSAVYRQGTAHDADAALADPDNRLLWRFPRRRLEAEAIRDGLLAVAGTLDRTLGGTQLETGNFAYVTDEASRISSRYGGRRRSIYLPVVRNAVYDFFQAFDFVEPSVPNGKRARTTVAPQALWMLNNPFVAEAARGLAGRLLAEGADEASRVRRAYRLAYARPATDAEVRDALEYVAAFEVALVSREKDPTERRRQAWASLCHTLLASNEFVTLE
jgi:hypothetical protein